MTELRIEAISFPDHYCAVYRREGSPDIILDGPDGRPRRFPSATAAITAARLELEADRPATAPTERDLIGEDRWHEERLARQAAEQIEVFGGVVIEGRTVPVERRRR